MSGLYTEHSGPQHGYQFCQAGGRRFWIYNSGSDAVSSDTLFLDQYCIHAGNHAGTKVELLEKVFVYCINTLV